MLDARSALTSGTSATIGSINLSESPGFTLTQVAGAEKDLKKLLGKLPASVGTVLEHEGRTLMRIGPKQFWVLGDAPAAAAGCYVTPLSSGRTRIALSGKGVRGVLASCAAIDFHLQYFKLGQFVMTGIHHTPVLIHCIGDDEFHIYALRTFALAAWEWLEDVARGI